METTAIFEKVSFEQFMKDWVKAFPEDEDNEEFITEIYEGIKLPERSTSKSAGYDFFLPMDVNFSADGEMLIPTGIRCVNMADDDVLKIYPRSGLGTKYGFVPMNLTGIIDADYADSENEGHIHMKMKNGDEELELDAGKAFCQGIFSKYGTTADDKATEEVRNGGFGSTNK